MPPLPIQRKIAAVLAAYDELIENNLRRIEILEEMAQAVYREWFVEFRFPGYEDVEIVESELGPIPEGWAGRPASRRIVVRWSDRDSSDPKTRTSERGSLQRQRSMVTDGRKNVVDTDQATVRSNWRLHVPVRTSYLDNRQDVSSQSRLRRTRGSCSSEVMVMSPNPCRRVRVFVARRRLRLKSSRAVAAREWTAACAMLNRAHHRDLSLVRPIRRPCDRSRGAVDRCSISSGYLARQNANLRVDP